MATLLGNLPTSLHRSLLVFQKIMDHRGANVMCETIAKLLQHLARDDRIVGLPAPTLPAFPVNQVKCLSAVCLIIAPIAMGDYTVIL